DDGERDFADYEYAREAGVTLASARAAAAFTQVFELIGSSGLESGNEAEKNTGGEREQERKRQHTGADAHFIEAGKVGGGQRQNDVFQKQNAEKRDDSRKNGEQRAFRKQLTDKTSAARTQRETNCNFAPPPGSAREQQIRYVDTRDEQDKSHGAKQ